MTRRILFFGNCQLEVVRNLYDRFVAGATGDETWFLPSWTEVDAGGRKLLDDADILVEQRQSFDSSRPALSDTLPIIPVPLVSAAFLWPFAGSPHPNNAGAPGLPEGPFPSEFGDGFLNRMIRDGQTPEAALALYRAFPFDGANALDRRYELLIEQQKHRDEQCGFSIAPEIEAHLSETLLFLSPHHPGLRVTRVLAAECFRRLDVPHERIELMLDNVRQSPFPRDELPIHPVVAAHFGLNDAAQRTYAWLGEGRLTWDQWVLRYMAYAWSPPLFEGWSIASSKPAQARVLLEEALRQLPNSPLAHAGMAKVLQAQRDFKPAAVYAEEAVRLDPGNAEYARLGAFVAAADGRRQDAVRYAGRAAALEPGHAENLQLLARYQEETRDFTAAEASRRGVLRLRPRESVFHTDLGTVLMNQRRHEEALASYRHALTLLPTDAGALFGMSLVLNHLGQTTESVAAVRSAICNRPGIAAYYSHLGHLLLRLGANEQALDAFRSAIEQDPKSARLRTQLADILLQNLEDHNSMEAFEHAAIAAKLEPNELRYQLRHAHLLSRHARLLEAIEVYQHLFTIAPAMPRLHGDAAVLYARVGRYEEALSEYSIAIAANPNDTKSLAERADVLLKSGRVAEARESIEQALKIEPEQSQWRALLGTIAEIEAGRRRVLVPAEYLAAESEIMFPERAFDGPACIRFTNFADVNPGFGRHHTQNLYVDKPRWLSAVKLCRLPQGTNLAIVRADEFIPTVDHTVVEEQVNWGWKSDDVDAALAECTDAATLDDEVMLLARFGIRTWGHWLGEMLPKAVALEARWPGRFKYILPDRFVTDPIHTTGMQSLVRYGIGMDRFALLAPNTNYACRSLHVVSSAWSAERMIHVDIPPLMREQAMGEREPSPGWLKVALLRRSARTRNIANLPEVERILINHGFAVVDIEGMTFRQQVDLFANAQAVACILGSGLTGLMYAPRGVKVLTMAPAQWGDLFFFALMQERDAEYADIRGPSSAQESGNSATASFTVPLDALRRGLVALGLPEQIPQIAGARPVPDVVNAAA